MSVVKIHLDQDDVGQLLDGLRARADAWEKTAEYLETGYVSDDSFICEECSDSDEAKSIAEHYQRIILQIETQLRNQD